MPLLEADLARRRRRLATRLARRRAIVAPGLAASPA
jgi:hypothetical protein